MRHENFYTGELVDSSPPISEEKEAASNASFGMYDYDPGYRQQIQQQTYPGNYYGYGGYQQPQQQYQYPYYGQMVGLGGGYNTGYNPYMNYGYGYQQNQYNSYYTQQNPYYYNPGYQQNYGYGYNPYMNPGYNMYQQNPYYYQQPQQQYQQPIPQSVYIAPFSPGGEYLPPIDHDKKIEELKSKYWNLIQEDQAKKETQRYNNGGFYNNYGMNYYGIPFYNQYSYNSSIQQQMQEDVNKMIDEAKEARRKLNIELSKNAHRIANDGVSEEEIENLYNNGRTIEIPQERIVQYYNQSKYENLIPFDNSEYYRQLFGSIHREYTKYVPEDSTIKNFGENIALIEFNEKMAQEDHRRRNGKIMYQSGDSYKFFVKSMAAERYEKESGVIRNSTPISPVFSGQRNMTTMEFMREQLKNFPTLSQSAHLSDDGTLNITCNFGSKAGQTYTVKNSEEARYDQDRARFNQFLDEIPKAIYGSGGGSS
jgi:hypothetical protein